MEQGVNLVGYARAAMGLGESCRNAAASLEAVHVPFGILNYEQCLQEKNVITWAHKEMDAPRYNCSMYHINADQMQYALLHYRKQELHAAGYNIGYWHWELPKFPEEWRYAYAFIDELWVPSHFVKEACEPQTNIPIKVMPHAITAKIETPLSRTYFQLPEQRFLFLTMYDSLSHQARKNPLGVIEAFQAAFASDDKDVGLVVKVSRSQFDAEDIKRLHALIAGYENIYLIEGFKTRDEIYNLIALCDCYASFHRSEGFGLPIAEAMRFGRPVIATNWSGNTDFMTEETSCPLRYTLSTVKEDHGPYKKGQIWAEPDLEHGAYCMKKVKDNRHYRETISKAASQHILSNYHPQKIGELMKERLVTLDLLQK
ncbi:group 1 glycosyl transferase [Fictibacillus macauensis ZFHKF-1]|uniref:Group 1 glycosyl transferase n=1 Tax=Fictibacillus macauensis ZFHKF-1 TaxID=1196324 RepID=I8AG50_9BACL|nr:glycosyltransferase family 4 protein [Fictibacillus macauensis]EIT84622.1 group 1 glycosyl transferase [Fictibacillus macauensis ZFHKF-1]